MGGEVSGTNTEGNTGASQQPTVRQPPSASMSGGTAASVIIIGNWLLKLKYGQEMPADVVVAAGLVLAGAAHGAQLAWLYFTDARVQPKPVLPPKGTTP